MVNGVSWGAVVQGQVETRLGCGRTRHAILWMIFEEDL